MPSIYLSCSSWFPDEHGWPAAAKQSHSNTACLPVHLHLSLAPFIFWAYSPTRSLPTMNHPPAPARTGMSVRDLPVGLSMHLSPHSTSGKGTVMLLILRLGMLGGRAGGRADRQTGTLRGAAD
jgi:hypothetical protein